MKDGLLAYYDGECNVEDGYDILSLLWKDLSNNGNDASIKGLDFTEESGWKEKAIKLDGVDDEIKFPVEIPAAGTFSVEIIFKEQNYNSYFVLYADKDWSSFCFHTHNQSYGGKQYADGDVFIGANYRDTGDTERFIPEELDYKTTLGKIDSVVYTFDGAKKEMTVYANGEMIGQKTVTQDIDEIEYFQTGITQKDYYRLSFYNKVLSEEEVKQNYNIDKYRFNIEE